MHKSILTELHLHAYAVLWILNTVASVQFNRVAKQKQRGACFYSHMIGVLCIYLYVRRKDLGGLVSVYCMQVHCTSVWIIQNTQWWQYNFVLVIHIITNNILVYTNNKLDLLYIYPSKYPKLSDYLCKVTIYMYTFTKYLFYMYIILFFLLYICTHAIQRC